MTFAEGYRSYPLSMPFEPGGRMSDPERAFYAGWIEAALTHFNDNRREPPNREKTYAEPHST